MSARWPPCPLGGLPLTPPSPVGGGATVPTAAPADLLQIQRHLGGGVPFEERSKGLHSGSSRGSLALEPGLEACTTSLLGIEPQTKAICKVKTTNDIVDGLVDFYNLVFNFI